MFVSMRRLVVPLVCIGTIVSAASSVASSRETAPPVAWSFRPAMRVPDQRVRLGAPTARVALAGDHLVVAGTVGADHPRDADVALTALDPVTGDRVWRLEYGEADEPTDETLLVDLAANASALFVGATRSSAPMWLVRAHSAADGTVLWEDKRLGPQESIQSLELFANRLVVAGEDFESAGGAAILRAYRRTDGRLLWKQRAEVGAWNNLVATARLGPRLLLATETGDSADDAPLILRALRSGNGTTAWSEQLVGRYWSDATLAAANRRVVVAGLRHRPTGWELVVQVRDAGSGSIEWQRAEATEATSSPVVAVRRRTVVLASFEDGLPRVRAFELRTGAELWSTVISGRSVRMPAHLQIDETSVYFAATEVHPTRRDDFLVMSLDRTTGEARWRYRRDHGSVSGPQAMTLAGPRLAVVGAETRGTPQRQMHYAVGFDRE